MNQCTPDRFFTFADSSHQGPCICKGDWYGSSESGSPRIPRPAIHRTNMSYLHSTFIQTHLHSHTGISWWKLWNWASQLFLTDHNGKCFHLWRILMVPKLQKWWNVEEKFQWPNRDSNPEHWNESRTLYPLHHQNPLPEMANLYCKKIQDQSSGHFPQLFSTKWPNMPKHFPTFESAKKKNQNSRE